MSDNVDKREVDGAGTLLIAAVALIPPNTVVASLLPVVVKVELAVPIMDTLGNLLVVRLEASCWSSLTILAPLEEVFPSIVDCCVVLISVDMLLLLLLSLLFLDAVLNEGIEDTGISINAIGVTIYC
jgi:hypothetical protein